MIEAVADCGELFKLCARRVGAQIVNGCQRDVERSRRIDAVEIEDRDRNTRFDDAPDGVWIVCTERRGREAHKLACGRDVVERACARAITEVGEVAREQVSGEVAKACGQARRVRVELAPEMRGTVERVVGLEDDVVPKLALEADVCLITFGNAQSRIKPAREVRLHCAELTNNRTINIKRLRKSKIRGDESAALLVCERATSRRIEQGIRVEEDARLTEREIVNCAEQNSIEEDACTEPHDGAARAERIVGERKTRREVVVVMQDRFALITQAETEHHVRAHAPLILRECGGVKISLG